MKQYSVILLLCILFAGAGCSMRVPEQSSSAPPDTDGRNHASGDSREECLESIRRARSDARYRTYRMYVFGRERYDARFSVFLTEYMQTTYNIELIVLGENDRDRDKCYSNEMDKIIFNTFGPDILARAEQEARDLFDNGR
jgi:hypothetical protein